MKISPTAVPGTNKLFRDYINSFDNVKQFFQIAYNDENAILSHLESLTKRDYPAGPLAATLEKQNKKFGAGGATFENINKLRERNAFAVVTGQQVGLFGGPMYVLYKALTAVKLASHRSRQFVKNFVPVFWLAADDSDYEEINHITYLDKNYQNTLLQIEKTATGNLPVSEVRLGEQINNTIAQLFNGLHDSEFKGEVFKKLSRAYVTNETMSHAFGCWLMTLLKAYGLIIIDPTDSTLKPLVAKIFVEEIQNNSPSTKAVLQTSKVLTKLGYSPQVPLRGGRLNLFYLDRERKPLEINNGRISTTDGTSDFSYDEILSVISSTPERFSPNVILRALTQDTLFPTAAYVAGPAEVSYFAQLKGVYAHFDIPMPAIYPRKSLTLVEPNTHRILEKYNLHIEDIWGDIEIRITEFTRANLPEELTVRFAEMRSDWPQVLHGLRDSINSVDPTLVKMLENTSGKIVNIIETLEKKVIQASKRKNDVMRQQLYKAAASIYPDHTLQERIHNFTPYLVKYGLDFIEQIYDALDLSDYHHQIVRL